MLSQQTLLLLCLLILFLSYRYRGERHRLLPPGPSGYPILGNLLQIIGTAHLKLSKLASEYGDMFTVKLGNRTAIVLSSPRVMKDILGSEAGTGKFHCETLLVASNGPYGISHTVGAGRNEVRQFYIKNMKQFGFGNRSSWEPFTLSEADKMIEWIRENIRDTRSTSKTGIRIKTIQSALQNSANSSLWSMMTRGDNAHKNYDSAIHQIMEDFVGAMQYSVGTGLVFFGKLKYISPEWSGYLGLKRACANLAEYVEVEYERHSQSFKEGQIRDLMDSYLEHLKTVVDASSSFYGKLGYQNAIASITETLIASYETTGSTITWALVYLATHPQVQMKLREEVNNAIGLNWDPSLDDRRTMPYAVAVIEEIFRYSSIVPLGVPHELVDDMVYEGYLIPKGTIIIPNLYHAHFRKDIWKDPETFRPERFLENMSLKEHVIPFQVGKRMCPGREISIDTLFLYLIKLIQKFEFCMDESTMREEYLKPEDGYFLMPRDFKLIIKEHF